MNFRLINVGIGNFKVTHSPDILRTVLGSCVGVCLYDSKSQLVGLSHVMLPEQKVTDSNPMKYVNTAIPMLLEEMISSGATRENIQAKIFGGAVMFNLNEKTIMAEIGKINISKTKEVLNLLRIPIVAEDVGGDFGRTIDFFAESGKVKIKSLGREEREI